MFEQMGGYIGPCLEDEEEHEHRHRRLDPKNLQGKYHDAAENNGDMHRNDSLVRAEELLIDEAGTCWTLVPVLDVRIEVVCKEQTTGEPDTRIGKIHRTKDT